MTEVQPAAPPIEARRLDPRSIAVQPLQQVGGLLPLAAAYLLFHRGADAGQLVVGLLVLALLVAGSALRWTRYKYRLTGDRLEIWHGLVSVRHVVVPVDRIRGVDIEVQLSNRLLGVAAVSIDAADTGGGDSRTKLNAVSHAEARRLRDQLLRHSTPATTSAAAPPPAEVLIRMPARWLLYAPFFGSLLAALPAGVGAVWSFGQQFQLVPDYVDPDTIRRWLGWLIAALVLGTPLAAIALAALRFHGWTVTDRGHELAAERGLLTRRMVGLERARLRGYLLAEPLLGRPVRIGRLTAQLSGLDGADRSLLLPIAPLPAVEALAARLLPTYSGPWQAHPPAAFRRRLVRALVPAAAALVVALILRYAWLFAVAGGLAGLGVLLAWDLYRSLGHGLTDRIVASRRGSLSRDSQVLQRSRPIGFRVRQTFFQRRAGLATFDIAMLAGRPMQISDLAAEDVARIAADLLPEIVRPLTTEGST